MRKLERRRGERAPRPVGAGRPIVAHEVGDSTSPRNVLIVGCVNGNGPAGVAVARTLERFVAPPGVDRWVVLSFNPGGQVAASRRTEKAPSPGPFV